MVIDNKNCMLELLAVADNTENNHNQNYPAQLHSDRWADSSWACGPTTGL